MISTCCETSDKLEGGYRAGVNGYSQSNLSGSKPTYKKVKAWSPSPPDVYSSLDGITAALLQTVLLGPLGLPAENH